jgi:hypothetical protein
VNGCLYIDDISTIRLREGDAVDLSKIVMNDMSLKNMPFIV